jgi:hypothetical protein
MKRGAPIAFVLSILLITAPAGATDQTNEVPTISGLATNALARAYEVSGLNGTTPPPLRLQPYYVAIQADGEYFKIFFLAQTEARAIPFVIAARTGAVIWKEGQPANRAVPIPPNMPLGYVLPGIIAGEIIEAYQHAILDRFKPLSTGGYNTRYFPLGGGVDVGFEALVGAPQSVSMEPGPTPTPNPAGCFGRCAHGPMYALTIRNGVVTIAGPVYH